MKIDPARLIAAASGYETGRSVTGRRHGTLRASPETDNLVVVLWVSTGLCAAMHAENISMYRSGFSR
jgi:hypothetical protein